MVLEEIIEGVRRGRVAHVKELTQKALDEGLDPNTVIDEGLIKGMGIVGELFGGGKMFVPEVMIASKAMNAGMEILKPLLKGAEVAKKGTCVFATVKGDLHDIGKKLVMLMMEGAGYKIVDLGVDIAPDVIVDAAKKENADIVGMSAMLTTTMPFMKEVCGMLKEQGLDNIKVMLGGAPVNEDYAAKVGGHYSPDASAAVRLADSLMGK